MAWHLSSDALSRLGACKDQRRAFSAAYPDGVELTEPVIRAWPDRQSVIWLACRVMPDLRYWCAGLAFREAARVHPALAPWAEHVTPSTWQQAYAAARAAVYAAAYAARAAYAAVYAARAAYAAYAVDARAARAADDATDAAAYAAADAAAYAAAYAVDARAAAYAAADAAAYAAAYAVDGIGAAAGARVQAEIYERCVARLAAYYPMEDGHAES